MINRQRNQQDTGNKGIEIRVIHPLWTFNPRAQENTPAEYDPNKERYSPFSLGRNWRDNDWHWVGVGKQTLQDIEIDDPRELTKLRPGQHIRLDGFPLRHHYAGGWDPDVKPDQFTTYASGEYTVLDRMGDVEMNLAKTAYVKPRIVRGDALLLQANLDFNKRKARALALVSDLEHSVRQFRATVTHYALLAYARRADTDEQELVERYSKTARFLEDIPSRQREAHQTLKTLKIKPYAFGDERCVLSGDGK